MEQSLLSARLLQLSRRRMLLLLVGRRKLNPIVRVAGQLVHCFRLSLALVGRRLRQGEIVFRLLLLLPTGVGRPKGCWPAARRAQVGHGRGWSRLCAGLCFSAAGRCVPRRGPAVERSPAAEGPLDGLPVGVCDAATGLLLSKRTCCAC